MNLSKFRSYISSKPCIVYFTATWCKPCKAVSPVFEKLEREGPSEIYFIKIDIDEHPEISEYCNIDSIPSCIVYYEGRILNGYRFEGVHETQLQNGYKHLLSLLYTDSM